MRRATIRTTHDDPDAIARAIAPDNTDEMTTTVEGADVLTRIERETTGGLHSTVDDYVVNVDVAMETVQHARDANRPTDADASDANDTDNNDTNDE